MKLREEGGKKKRRKKKKVEKEGYRRKANRRREGKKKFLDLLPAELELLVEQRSRARQAAAVGVAVQQHVAQCETPTPGGRRFAPRPAPRRAVMAGNGDNQLVGQRPCLAMAAPTTVVGRSRRLAFDGRQRLMIRGLPQVVSYSEPRAAVHPRTPTSWNQPAEKDLSRGQRYGRPAAGPERIQRTPPHDVQRSLRRCLAECAGQAPRPGPAALTLRIPSRTTA